MYALTANAPTHSASLALLVGKNYRPERIVFRGINVRKYCKPLLGMIAASATMVFSSIASANNVTVVNKPGNAVPIRGTVNIGNSVLPVEVSNADPIPVVISGDPAARGIKLVDAKTINVGGVVADQCASYTVPAGKRLVLEHASILMNASPADFQAIDVVKVEIYQGSDRWHVALLGQAMPSGRFAVSQPLTTYVDAGQTVFILLGLSAPATTQDQVFCDMVGRLIDMP